MGEDNETPRKRQKRGVETEQRVLEAAEALMREGGFDAAQISRIVEVSGVSNGSFYHHFGSKETIVRRMIDRYCTVAKARIDTLELAHLSYEQAIARAIHLTIELFELNPELYRTMGARVKAEPDIWRPLKDLRAYHEAKIVTGIRELLMERGIQNPEQAVGTMMQTVLAISTHTVLFSSGPLRLEHEPSRKRIVSIALSILELDATS